MVPRQWNPASRDVGKGSLLELTSLGLNRENSGYDSRAFGAASRWVTLSDLASIGCVLIATALTVVRAIVLVGDAFAGIASPPAYRL